MVRISGQRFLLNEPVLEEVYARHNLHGRMLSKGIAMAEQQLCLRWNCNICSSCYSGIYSITLVFSSEYICRNHVKIKMALFKYFNNVFDSILCLYITFMHNFWNRLVLLV